MARAGAGEAVEQARLASIRPAGDHDLHPFANQPAATRDAEQRVDVVERSTSIAVGCGLGVDEVIALVGKVQRRLEPRGEIEQALVDLADLAT